MSEHQHDDHAPVDDDGHTVTETDLLERALRELLIEKGVITAAEVNAKIDDIDSRNPALGAAIVAKAWTEPDFKARLLDDPRAAVAELGIDTGGLAELMVIENTPEVHNVVVCTLCSCYPRMILGIPPAWYKSAPYRSRVVADPRGVLAEFGTDLPDGVSVRVHDSTADLRYLILPMRPAGTESMSAEELAGLVTRDSMIGATPARSPDAAEDGRDA
jgi:nitrile hydratase